MQFFRRDTSSDDKDVDVPRRSREIIERSRSDREQVQPQPVSPQPLPEIGVAPAAPGVVQAETPVDPLATYRQDATVVAKGTSFNGTLKSDTNLYIEGNFDGELEARSTVFIAAMAQVQADVRATDVIVAGTLTGTVDANGRFQAMPSAHISGEINSAVLVVEEGATINCSFAMKT